MSLSDTCNQTSKLFISYFSNAKHMFQSKINIWQNTSCNVSYMSSGVDSSSMMQQLPDYKMMAHLASYPQRRSAVRSSGVWLRALGQQVFEYLMMAILCSNEQWRRVVLKQQENN